MHTYCVEQCRLIIVYSREMNAKAQPLQPLLNISDRINVFLLTVRFTVIFSLVDI